MTKLARIVNSVAVDVMPEAAVPPHWLQDFVAVPDEVQPQWVQVDEVVGDAKTGQKVWRAPGTWVEEYQPGKFRQAVGVIAPPPVQSTRRATRLAFRNRFTRAEKAGIEMAALDNPSASLPARQAAAALRADLADQRDATYIDLTRSDTRSGVLALEAAGLLAAGRALQILDAPLQEHEMYRGE